MRAHKTTTIQWLGAADIDDYAAILCDLDGCLVSAGSPLPGAEEFVRAAGKRLSIVSNNSADTSVTLSRKLTAIGLPLPQESIFLAGELTVRMIAAEHPGARVHVIAEQPLHQLAADLGLERADERADTVLLARDTRFTLNGLEKALRLLERGAELVVTNPDLSHPNPDGLPVPETGTLLAAFKACCPGITARVIGKPQPFLIDAALSAAGVRAADAAFVGDNATTDGAAAALAGLDFIHLVAPPMPMANVNALRDTAEPVQPAAAEANVC
ncbi:HAD family hydrolase [Stappia sp. BW2]|uniref:HAD-IIA family hydrolase n=1 Tax=Stappia sp. BW2 TaxID=2592622 RepID=UPI0011DE9B3B|nr:HAD family hydrolase [Stappia sp. BW2]TYC66791.1 HAD family hydrolase [Stappia sp. BW2]